MTQTAVANPAFGPGGRAPIHSERRYALQWDPMMIGEPELELQEPAGSSRATIMARFAVRVATLTGGNSVTVSSDVRRRLFVLFVVLITIPIVIGFAVYGLVIGATLDAVVLSAFSLLLVTLAVLLFHLRKPVFVYYTVLSALMILLTYFVADPVAGATRIYWLFVFVPVATFTLGRWPGIAFGAGLLVLVGVLASGLVPFGPVIAAPSFLRFAISYAVLAALVHIAEYTHDRTHGSLASESGIQIDGHGGIRRLPITDALTRTYNRQVLADRLPCEVERARRYQHPLSVIICDIDGFKRVNDSHGHLAGDYYLRWFAETLGRTLRHEIDWIARFSGEEFIVVLPETSREAARIVAERLRSRVETLEVAWQDSILSCTASFGLAAVEDGPPDSESLIQIADRRLSEAKKAGQNRVVAD